MVATVKVQELGKITTLQYQMKVATDSKSKSKQPLKALSSLSRPPTTDSRPFEAGRRTVSHFYPPQLVSYVTQNDLVYYIVKDIKAIWSGPFCVHLTQYQIRALRTKLNRYLIRPLKR